MKRRAIQRLRGRALWAARWAMLLTGLCLLAGPAVAQPNSAAALASRHAAVRDQLLASPLGVPVLVTSVESGEQTRGEVLALLPLPFDTLAADLGVPRDWCAIVLLHLNIKACTHESLAGQDWLTFYSGRKGLESAEQAYPLRFAFRAIKPQSDYLDIDLQAATGPLATRDYRITLDAIAVPQGSFVRFGYTYHSSTLSRLAMKTYLATLGRDKVGFTVVGPGPDGKPLPVQGNRGIVERNAVRYYYAIQAHLEGLARPKGQRFERDLERWFELTERHPRQLHELERGEYLQAKRREFAEQSKRQQALDTAGAANRAAPAR